MIYPNKYILQTSSVTKVAENANEIIYSNKYIYFTCKSIIILFLTITVL